MGNAPTCPRCGGSVRAPGLWSSAWECAEHGSVAPFRVMNTASAEALDHVGALATVPVWRPVGLGPEWSCCAVAYAGDEREGARATALVVSGPHPLAGEAELLLLAEEPGIGLGARLAGLPEVDPGERIAAGPPDGRVTAARHPTPLWHLPGRRGDAASDRAAFVGEAKGLWLWLAVWPADAGVLVYDAMELVDHREASAGADGELQFGPTSRRLLG